MQDPCIWMHQTSGYRRENTSSSPPRSYGVWNAELNRIRIKKRSSRIFSKPEPWDALHNNSAGPLGQLVSFNSKRKRKITLEMARKFSLDLHLTLRRKVRTFQAAVRVKTAEFAVSCRGDFFSSASHILCVHLRPWSFNHFLFHLKIKTKNEKNTECKKTTRRFFIKYVFFCKLLFTYLRFFLYHFKIKMPCSYLQDPCIWMHQTCGYRRETTSSSPPRSYGVWNAY